MSTPTWRGGSAVEDETNEAASNFLTVFAPIVGKLINSVEALEKLVVGRVLGMIASTQAMRPIKVLRHKTAEG